jgi:hypothetical protein
VLFYIIMPKITRKICADFTKNEEKDKVKISIIVDANHANSNMDVALERIEEELSRAMLQLQYTVFEKKEKKKRGKGETNVF